MAAVYATVADYAARTGTALSDPQMIQVAALLEEASALMRGNAADLDLRITSGALEPTLAIGVCVRAVQRYLANPTQAAQVTTGPFSRAWAVANARGLYLTEDDLAALAPGDAGPTPPGVGTIRVGLPVGTVRHHRPEYWPR